MLRLACCLLILGIFSSAVELSQAMEPDVQVFGDPEEIAFDRHVRQLFQQRLSVNFNHTPLGAVAAELQRQLGVPITLDRKALEDAGAGDDTPITLHCQNLSGRDILENILGAIDLTWLTRGNYVMISTPEKASSELVTRVYPVADLVAAGDGGGTYENGLDYDSLIDLITSTIAPTTWDEVGGPGSIAPALTSGAIVFSQTRDVHERVERLFEALRLARDTQGLRVYDYVAALETQQQRLASFQNQSSQPMSNVHHVPVARLTVVQGWRLPRRHD